MKKTLLFLLVSGKILAQSAETINDEFEAINKSISNISCKKGQLLTNRAMNLFMADGLAYYLADHENLTFCKNNITVNSATGIFSMSHSLFQPTGEDLPVKSFNAIGLKTNVFNAFQATANKTTFNNELGITYKHFWLSKPKTILNNCQEKLASDVSRAIILRKIQSEISSKAKVFEKELHTFSDSTKTELRENFYKNLKEEFSRKFAEEQFDDLFKTMRFKKVSMHWTNLNVYLPVIQQRFTAAENLNTDFRTKKSYPAELSISHSHFIEWKNATKLFLNLRAGVLSNNSFNSRLLKNTNLENYIIYGGKKANYLIDNEIDRAIIGNFKNFITPNIKGQIIYFPPENHFGLSVNLEQNFGKYKATNATLGIPVVLIDKQSYALSNFEIQIHFFDITNTINPARSLKNNISLGLTWGQAIGRRVY